MNLQESITKVALLRDLHSSAKNYFRTIKEHWDADNSDAIVAVIDSGKALKAAEDELRTGALAVYRATDNVKPHAALQIKQKTIVAYNPGVALAWAQEHHLCLILDEPRFVALAKGGSVDCATVKKEPTCTIATDLSQYLDEKD